MSSIIKGELLVNYNGDMTPTHLKTDSGMVEGLGDTIDNALAENFVADAQAHLISSDSFYSKGTIILETDTRFFKIADGINTYNNLPYVQGKQKYVIEVLGSDGVYR